MATNMPVLPLSRMALWLGNQASQRSGPFMERPPEESWYKYFMRWAAMHQIRVDFYMETYSGNTLFNPIVCVPIGMHSLLV